MKIPIRATQKKQRGRMRPAGCQFDMPALECHVLFEWPLEDEFRGVVLSTLLKIHFEFNANFLELYFNFDFH